MLFALSALAVATCLNDPAECACDETDCKGYRWWGDDAKRANEWKATPKYKHILDANPGSAFYWNSRWCCQFETAEQFTDMYAFYIEHDPEYWGGVVEFFNLIKFGPPDAPNDIPACQDPQ